MNEVYYARLEAGSGYLRHFIQQDFSVIRIKYASCSRDHVMSKLHSSLLARRLILGF